MNYPLITLYVPGTRPELIEKAARCEPDAVIIDLEDTVPPDRKNQVRQDIADILPSVALPVIVRVNNDPDFLEADLKAMTNEHVYGLFLPKAEDPAQIKQVDAMLAAAQRHEFDELLVWKVSRFGRSVRHNLDLLHQLYELGVGVHFVKDGLDASTPANRARMV